MEKILKRLFIISILISVLTIPKVYAEEPTNLYFATSYSRFQFNSFSSNVNEYSPDTISFSAFSSDFILHYGFNYNIGTARNFCFIVYDKVNNLYILQCNILGTNESSCAKINGTYHIDISENGWLNCKNESDQWLGIGNAKNFYSILSTQNETTYFKSIDNSLTPQYRDNGIYYLTQNNNNNASGKILQFYPPNAANFELAGITTDFKLYFNKSEVPLVSSSEPEEPEEPQEPTIPPYNFNNNKYYVPNYHEGQCVEVLDKDTIRVFEDNFTSFYTDYFINSNYISKTGQVDLSYEKNCSTLDFTDIRYYGNDFPQILIITLVIITFTIGFPYILYKRFRKR